MESFFSSLKTERTARKTCRTRNQAKADVFDYIERSYNPKRRHSTLGYARWVHDPYFQYFTGEEFFQHSFPHERSDLSHWRQRLGDKLELLLAESLRVAHASGALRTKDLARVTVDTTVQPKAITFPTDAKLLHAPKPFGLVSATPMVWHRSATRSNPSRSALAGRSPMLRPVREPPTSWC
jgi:hypothetical protein